MNHKSLTMCFSITFFGEFTLNKPLTPAQTTYLRKFADTPRLARKVDIVSTIKDPLREAVNLPLGEEGEYFTGENRYEPYENQKPTLLHSPYEKSTQPKTQPSQYCCWGPNENGTAITWTMHDDSKTYDNWLEYIIQHFLTPWGYTLNGQIETNTGIVQGLITIKDNVVTVNPPKEPVKRRIY